MAINLDFKLSADLPGGEKIQVVPDASGKDGAFVSVQLVGPDGSVALSAPFDRASAQKFASLLSQANSMLLKA